MKLDWEAESRQHNEVVKRKNGIAEGVRDKEERRNNEARLHRGRDVH